VRDAVVLRRPSDGGVDGGDHGGVAPARRDPHEFAALRPTGPQLVEELDALLARAAGHHDARAVRRPGESFVERRLPR
jgi:hypothetical protein